VSGRPRGKQALTEVWKIRLTPEESATVDQRRGTSTRSAYVRRALQAYGAGSVLPAPQPPTVGSKERVPVEPDATHRHKRQPQPYRYEQHGYSKTPIYHCTDPDCTKELTG
jgi:hypothetical protein